MKNGNLVGGIAIGALIGVGIGYLIGVDAEKRKHWLSILSGKLSQCNCDYSCDNESGECNTTETEKGGA